MYVQFKILKIIHEINKGICDIKGHFQTTVAL